MSEPKDDAPKTVGRPSSFRPEFIEQADKLSKLGLTDAEMASFFEVSVRTLHRWKIESEEFCHSIKTGKAHADERVERSLYMRATGYDYVEQQAFKVKCDQYEERVEVVEVERHQPADTTAGIFWMKNRRSDQWRDKREVEVNDASLAGLDRDQLATFVAAVREARGSREAGDTGSRH